MPSYNIVVLGGDGVGPEIVSEAVKVLNVIQEHTDAKFNFQDHLFGGVRSFSLAEILSHS